MDEDDTDDYSPLLKAVKNGHLDKVRSLVSQGADVKERDAEGWTPILIAVKTGRVDVLIFLIDQGADVRKFVRGRTALDFALQFGNLDAIKYLISHGAYVDKTIYNIHFAAKNGHLDVLEYLITQGAEVNKGNYIDDTALHIAAQNGHLDVAKYLISKGAEVKKGDKYGETALHTAAQNGHFDVVKYLISQGAEVNTETKYGRTALNTAAQGGHLDVVKYLISQGAEVKRGDNYGETALYTAARKGHLDVVKYLISHGAEVNTQTRYGRTALNTAAQGGHLDVVKNLISQGADVNKLDNYGRTALRFAAENGHLDVVKYLISQGAEVNKGDNIGETPLHTAAENCHLHVVKYMISQGAEVNIRLEYGWTALHYAPEDDHLDDVEYRAYHVPTSQKASAEDEDLDVTKYVTREGVEISDEACKQEISRKKSPIEIGSKIYVEDRSGKLPMYDAKDEEVEQTILSRMKSPKETHYYQESVNTDMTERPRKSKVSAEAVSEDFATPQGYPNLADKREQSEQNESQTQTTESDIHTDDEEYNLISLEKYCITVRISKHEIYSAKDINVEVIEEVPPELKLKETEAIISVGLKMSPSDAVFDSPVIVTMPHCGAFTKPKDAEVFIYHRKNDSTEFTAIRSTSTSSPRCVVRDRDLDIYLNHFSRFRIAAKLTRIFIGKCVICTPIIPVSPPRNPMPVLLVKVRDQNVAEGQIRKGYDDPTGGGVQFLVRWRSGGLKVTCKESTLKDEAKIIKEREFRHLTEHKIMFEVDTQNITVNDFNLHIILQQSTTKDLIVPMSLKETVTVISEGETSSLSMIPISSQSAGNHPAETINSGSTSETRGPTREESVKDFDDILREIAKQVNERQHIDALGVKLGFQPAEILPYLDNNRNASYMGTLQMLRDWRNRTKKSEERELFRQALIGIKYIRLADELLP